MNFSFFTPYFSISFSIKVFESDTQPPSNSILTVLVDSDGFGASANMDIDIKHFVYFVEELSALYTTLQGTAVLEEAFGKQFIKFSINRTGQICINGRLHSNGHHGFLQELSFQNCVEPTSLTIFLKKLTSFCEKYR